MNEVIRMNGDNLLFLKAKERLPVEIINSDAKEFFNNAYSISLTFCGKEYKVNAIKFNDDEFVYKGYSSYNPYILKNNPYFYCTENIYNNYKTEVFFRDLIGLYRGYICCNGNDQIIHNIEEIDIVKNKFKMFTVKCNGKYPTFFDRQNGNVKNERKYHVIYGDYVTIINEDVEL